IVLATRAALRVLPFVKREKEIAATMLPAFRAAGISLFAAKYPGRAVERAAYNARTAYRAKTASAASDAAYDSASAVYSRFWSSAVYAKSAIGQAANAIRPTEPGASSFRPTLLGTVNHDVQLLHSEILHHEQLAASPLWQSLPPSRIGGAWQGLEQDLLKLGGHWRIWTDWYGDILGGGLRSEDEDAAFTDVSGDLPWTQGAEAVNTEIARRLTDLRNGIAIGAPRAVIHV